MHGKYNKNKPKTPIMKRNKSLESMKIRTMLGKKHKSLRLCFTHYVVEKYGINIYTAHTRFRRGILSQWMIVGIRGCIREFLEDDSFTDFENFYKDLPVKSKFIEFMQEEMGMCERTARERFKKFDFSELELIGLEAVYEQFIEEIIKE